MEFEYPEKPKQTHKIIVKKLLQGEFISIGKREYEVLWSHKEWYASFFLNSFNIELLNTEEVFYCTNHTGGMNFTKEILTVLAILMYEISKEDADPIIEIQNKEFSLDIINKYLSNSVQFSGYISKNKIEIRFINRLEQMGLVKKTNNDRFIFTRAINIFLKEYDDLTEQVIGMGD